MRPQRHHTYRGILGFLERHREMVKLREKEMGIYGNQTVAFHCSVEGLLAMKGNGVGDLEPTHILDSLKVVSCRTIEMRMYMCLRVSPLLILTIFTGHE